MDLAIEMRTHQLWLVMSWISFFFLLFRFFSKDALPQQHSGLPSLVLWPNL